MNTKKLLNILLKDKFLKNNYTQVFNYVGDDSYTQMINKIYGNKYSGKLLPVIKKKGDDNVLCIYKNRYFIINIGAFPPYEVELEFSNISQVKNWVLVEIKSYLNADLS